MNEAVGGIPVQFGSTESPLAGVHHIPPAEADRRAGVVACAPFGSEAIHAHRALRLLTVGLARQGLHALRFDLHGAGESAGEAEDVCLESWLDDIDAAIGYLREAGRAVRIAVLGLRLGATLAALGGARRGDLTGCVLWEPAIRGEEHLIEMRASHDARLREMPALVWPNEAEVLTEYLGVIVPAALRRDLAGVDLLRGTSAFARRALVIETAEGGGRELAERQEALGCRTCYRCLPHPPIWSRNARGQLVPADVLSEMVSWSSEALR